MATEPVVPASVEDINAEWLRTAAGAVFPGATFAELKIARIGADYGFASRIYRCWWPAVGRGHSLVVKLWDLDSPAGVNEVLFYQNFPDPGARIPDCFYSGIDRQSGKAVLVLEDLVEAEQGDVLRLLDLGQAQAVGNSLAGLHATWLAHPEPEGADWLVDVRRWRMDEEWYQSRRAQFLERFGEQLSLPARRLLDALRRAPDIANQRLAEAPPTLLHGDFHLDNILFEDGQPVLLDWSRPQRGPQALNLAGLVFAMTPLENYERLLDAYCERFNQLRPGSLDNRTLQEQLGGAWLRHFAVGTLGIARWQPDSRRGQQILENGIAALCETVSFWQGRDPELFSALGI